MIRRCVSVDENNNILYYYALSNPEKNVTRLLSENKRFRHSSWKIK